MDSPPAIEPATTDDLQALVALEKVSWDAYSSPRTAAEWESHVPDFPLDWTWVARGPDGIEGYFQIGPRTPLENNKHVIQLHSLAVHPEHRGKGLGLRLLTSAEETAREQGYTRLVLTVLACNAVAMGMYEQAGYREEGRLRCEFLIEGEFVDDVFLAKELV